MSNTNFAAYVAGIHGLAALRHWMQDDASELLDELKGTLNAMPSNKPVDVPEMDAVAGYGAWAATYDSTANPLINAEEPVVRRLIDDCPIGKALDAACGTGRYTAYLSARGHRVTGVDSSPGMLDVARKKVAEATFLQAQLSHLPFESDAFDVVVCALALEHCAELGPPIGELSRALRSGGVMILSVYHPINYLLGFGAFFQDSSGQYRIIRGFHHRQAEYMSAFISAKLELKHVAEPVWGTEEIEVVSRAFPRRSANALHQALNGIPIALIWCLQRK